MDFYSAALPEAGDGDRERSRAGQLEMPEDGSTTAVSGKGLSCVVRGLKVRESNPGSGRGSRGCRFDLLCGSLLWLTASGVVCPFGGLPQTRYPRISGD